MKEQNFKPLIKQVLNENAPDRHPNGRLKIHLCVRYLPYPRPAVLQALQIMQQVCVQVRPSLQMAQ